MELLITSLEHALLKNSTSWNKTVEEEGKSEKWTTEL